jgi:hypothetical protein
MAGKKIDLRALPRRSFMQTLMASGIVGVTFGASNSLASENGFLSTTDHADIYGLLFAYASALDEGRIGDCAALFSGATFTIEGVASVDGSQGVLELFSGIILYEDGTPRTKHLVTNVDVAVAEGGQTAAARSYLTVFQSVDNLPLQPIFSGTYDDRFEKSSGAWRFKERVVSGALFGDMSRHLRNPPN